MAKQKPTFEKSSPALVALFTELTPTAPGLVRKSMFGWPCWFLNGNLMAGLHEENMIFRLSDAELAEFLTTDGASEFEPMAGRKMRGYGMLAEPMSRDRRLLKRWISRSLEFVGSLPHKSAKTSTSATAGPTTRATTKTATKGRVKK